MSKRKPSRKILYAIYAAVIVLTVPSAISLYNLNKSAHPSLPSSSPISEAEIINFVRHDLGKTIAVDSISTREEHMQIAAPYMMKQANTMLADDLEKFGWFDVGTATYVDFTKPTEILETNHFEGTWSWVTETPVSVNVVKGESSETQNFYAIAIVQFREGIDTTPSFLGVKLQTDPFKPVNFGGILN
jgi:hypothetical protein